MKNLVSILAFCLTLVSASAVAQQQGLQGFSIGATGESISVDETQSPIAFDVSFEPGRYEHTFRIAANEFRVPELPKHYIITLMKNGDGVYAPELSREVMKSFKLLMDDYAISMQRRNTTSGELLVLSLNQFHYDFSGPYANIEIHFAKDGISSVKVKGLPRAKVIGG